MIFMFYSLKLSWFLELYHIYNLSYAKERAAEHWVLQIPTHLSVTMTKHCIFSIKAILKHKQVASMKRKMSFTIFKYLFLFHLKYAN